MTDTTTCEFDLYDVLAVTHGLPSLWEPYRAILEYITGAEAPSPVSAISLRPPCARWLLEQHPRLHEVPTRPDFDTEAEMDAWADEQKARLGVSSLPVAPLPPGRADFPAPGSLERFLDAAETCGRLDAVYVQDPGTP